MEKGFICFLWFDCNSGLQCYCHSFGKFACKFTIAASRNYVYAICSVFLNSVVSMVISFQVTGRKSEYRVCFYFEMSDAIIMEHCI